MTRSQSRENRTRNSDVARESAENKEATGPQVFS